MGNRERFKVYNSTTPLDFLNGFERVTIEDMVTGNRAEGCGRTREEAERNAWDRLKKIQGPYPSEKTRR